MTGSPHSPAVADETMAALERLLRESVVAWGIIARVDRDDAGGIRISALGTEAIVRRAAAGVPFRWMVEAGTRSRPATSISAVLRLVRLTFQPGHRGGRALAARDGGR